MKIENIYENKARFFALYWGVKCLRNEFLNDNIPPHKVDVSTCRGLPQQYLELTPLSQITDEDAVEVIGVSECHRADYLRSKGYALPWMGLSVEDLVSYGWVKIKS